MIDGDRITAQDIARNVEALLRSHGITVRHEYVLPNGRRMDVAGFAPNGDIAGVEIKIDPRDYRRDLKWPEYARYCRTFYFAVPKGFPIEIINQKVGIIVSTKTVAKIVRGLSGFHFVTPGGLLRA